MITVLIIAIILVSQFRRAGSQLVPINVLSEKINSEKVVYLDFYDTEVDVVFWDGETATTRIDPDKTITEQLSELGITLDDLSSGPIQINHVVRKHDTCFDIALRFNVSVEAIIELNIREDFSLDNICQHLTVGQKLLIPLPGAGNSEME
jgi:hypothetical protein